MWTSRRSAHWSSTFVQSSESTQPTTLIRTGNERGSLQGCETEFEKVLAFCLSDSLNNFPAILKHIAEVTVLSKRLHKMLTRTKKTRTTRNDRSCSQNSNQNYSTVPGNQAVEVEEMVTMDHGGTSVGLQDDGHRTDYLQVAWLLREKLNDLLDGDEGESLVGLRSLLDMAASRNIVSVDPEMLNPVLWRTLPKELLLHVYACLPVPDITRLCSLSREWRRDMATLNSDIKRACEEANPTIFAGFSRQYIMREGFRFPEFVVTICTQSLQYSYHLHQGLSLPGENRWDDMCARDGGLVCFVSTWKLTKSKPLCIVVVNLLTRVWRKLPPLQYVYSSPPQMMHMEVDSETKCYRVVVVGKNIKGRPRVEIYHSGARHWTKATPPLGFIFGVARSWVFNIPERTFWSTNHTRSVYDFAEGRLKSLDDKGRSRLTSLTSIWKHCKSMTFWKDWKFVLDKNISNNGEMLPAEGITKYRIQSNAVDWVQERSYLCSPFQDLFGKQFLRQWTLKACEGFVMVVPYSSYSDNDSHCGHFWLLDLATGEWRSLPNCFQGLEDSFLGHQDNLLVSRVFWNVMP